MTKNDRLRSAKIRAIAEQMQDGQNEAPPQKAPTMLRIPLEQIGEEGLCLSLSLTGTHFCIKVPNAS